MMLISVKTISLELSINTIIEIFSFVVHNTLNSKKWKVKNEQEVSVVLRYGCLILFYESAK